MYGSWQERVLVIVSSGRDAGDREGVSTGCGWHCHIGGGVAQKLLSCA